MRYAVVVAAVVCLAGRPADAGAQASQLDPVHAAALAVVPASDPLAEVRAQTERFRDVSMALAEGYIPDPTGMCVTAPFEGQPRQLGAMGIHYFRPDLLGITAVEPRVDGVGTHTDFTSPGVLIYEPQADGSLELVAVENLVWARPWREAGNESPPEFEGQEYYFMIDNPLTEVDEAHGFEPHYELHVWLYRENPLGVFMPFNPAAGCTHAPGLTGGMEGESH